VLLAMNVDIREHAARVRLLNLESLASYNKNMPCLCFLLRTIKRSWQPKKINCIKRSKTFSISHANPFTALSAGPGTRQRCLNLKLNILIKS
jgi:hypothetical protein